MSQSEPLPSQSKSSQSEIANQVATSSTPTSAELDPSNQSSPPPSKSNGQLSSTETNEKSDASPPSVSTKPLSTSNGTAPSSATYANGSQKQKPSSQHSSSFVSKLFRILLPCIKSSPNTHVIDPEHPVVNPTSAEKSQQVQAEKPVSSEVAKVESELPLKVEEKSTATSATQETPPALPTVPIIVDPIPPTPVVPSTPEDDPTAGLTSRDVQVPGSSAEPSSDEKTGPVTPTTPHNDSEDSEGNYTEEEEEEDELDEEDRLIFNGGAGIPIGPDGIPKPLLPPISPQHAGRKCLVLDLDETLVHSSFKSISQADYVVPVEIEYHWHNVYVIKRPGVDNFLKKMGEIYEVVVFTASLSKYADPVLDKLDIHQVVSHRLFRESCYNHKGNYVKDLSQLGRPIADTIILDNSPASYIFHPNNAVPVSSWFNDPHDTELTDLVPFLADLSAVEDVRGILDGAR